MPATSKTPGGGSGEEIARKFSLSPAHHHIYQISLPPLIPGVPMADLTITVPEDIVQALRPPPDTVAAELQRELAVALYQRGILSSGKAAALAGMTRWEWEEQLGARKIPRHYADEDLDQDIAYATRSEQ